jgi:hypothetical protein
MIWLDPESRRSGRHYLTVGAAPGRERENAAANRVFTTSNRTQSQRLRQRASACLFLFAARGRSNSALVGYVESNAIDTSATTRV